MNDGEKLASSAATCTSLAALIIAIIELPSDPSVLNLFIAAVVSAVILAGLSLYIAWRRRSPDSSLEEEKRLLSAFPRIYAFLESIDSIRDEDDYRKLESQLKLLIETEKQSRSIRWKQMQDIEAIKGIALAELVKKKRFRS